MSPTPLLSRSFKPLVLAVSTGLLMAAAVPSQAQPAPPGHRPPPPALRHERVPPPPARGYVWHHGSWRWDGHRYVWMNGRYYGPRH